MPPPAHDQTIEAIVACGVPAANIHIAYADELQSDLVTIRDLGGIDEPRLRCVHRAVHPAYVLAIEAADQQAAFLAVQERELSRIARAEAIDWLTQNGKLNRVPHYDSTRGLVDFARALEAACGFPQGSALEPLGEFDLTFRQGFLDEHLRAGGADAVACLTQMIAASNAGEHGIRLGFVTSGPAR